MFGRRFSCASIRTVQELLSYREARAAALSRSGDEMPPFAL